MSDPAAVAHARKVERPTTLFTALVTDDAFGDHDVERSVLEPIGCAVNLSRDGQLEGLEQADALLVSRMVIDETILRRGTKLKAIVRYGVGVENIDLEAAERRGIIVANTPDYCTQEVAEHVLAQILICARQIVRLNRLVHRGHWSPSDILPTHRLSESTLGLIGIGRIGSEVAHRARALGLEVIAHDPYVAKAPEGVALATLTDVLRESDFVSLHAPLTPATRGIIGVEQLTMMKPTAFLINASRGALIDEDALAASIRAGQIAGAALDVLSVEPPPADHPLLNLENVILTPHVAFYSVESLLLRKQRAAEAVRAVLLGQQPEWPVAPIHGAD
jgi:D-3-phosphoglycerate dehydrogenase / 2-oxoglutarate reductase